MRKVSLWMGLVLLLAGCGGGGNGTRSGVNITPTVPGVGKLYVSNAAANSILRYDGASTANGNVAPAVIITGSFTQLSSPAGVNLDVTNDRLFVANTGVSGVGASILIFDHLSTLASGTTANIAPTRVIAGAATALSAPVAVAFDRTKDILYVANGTDILAFGAASFVSGNVLPSRTIATGFAMGELLVDSAADRLFAANTNDNAVRVYDVASVLNGPTTASRVLAGAGTQLNSPVGLQIDAAGRLIVSNFSTPSLTVYAGAATLNGVVTPSAVVAGSSTGLVGPTEIAQNANTGELYVADGLAAAVLIYSSSANGNVAPTRVITGSNTGLARAGGTGPATARGVAIDPTR